MSESSAPPSWNETERLAALHSYGILDTARERAFDDIVELASQLLDVPIVAVNLIDADRQWFKSEKGLGIREMPLDDSFCKLALLESERMVVPDTHEDARLNCNRLVTGAPGLRFYAGELLKTDAGLPLGTLCVLDTRPRPQGLSELQALTLKTLAQQVQTQLELRRVVREQDLLLLEQQRMHALLQGAQERSRLATDAAGLGIWSWDPVSDVITWENERPYEILGIEHDDGPPTTREFMRRFLLQEDAPQFAAAITETLASGGQLHFQGRMRRTDGAVRWIDFRGKAQARRDGTPLMILGVVSDITTRKLAEVELQESRERFENIVSDAATGVVQAAPDGRITVVNHRFCAMLGYERADLIGRHVLDITADESRPATADALRRLAEGEASVVLQKQYRRQDGSLMWASSSVSVIRGPLRQFDGVVAIVVDISQDRATQESLRTLAADLAEADRRKSEFLATLAHELRNPLAPIRSGLTVLKLGGDNVASVTKIRAMMERQVAQMVRLIDDLLDVARISGGKIELQKSRVDMQSLLAAAIETSTPFIERGGHQLLVRQPEQALPLDADAARIAQVLSNLLNNSAKYTPLGGLIEVDLVREADQAVVTIRDNGIGIPLEALSTIFLMFNQAGPNMHRAQGGLGVGLSLVKRLVEMHEGTVVAASAGSGQGSSFTVRLPLLAEGTR